MLKLEVGEFYRNRRGTKVGPIIATKNAEFPFRVAGLNGGTFFTADGRVDAKKPTVADLVQLWFSGEPVDVEDKSGLVAMKSGSTISAHTTIASNDAPSLEEQINKQKSHRQAPDKALVAKPKGRPKSKVAKIQNYAKVKEELAKLVNPIPSPMLQLETSTDDNYDPLLDDLSNVIEQIAVHAVGRGRLDQPEKRLLRVTVYAASGVMQMRAKHRE